MGKLAVYRYFSLMFLVITVVVMFFTFAGLFGGSVDYGGQHSYGHAGVYSARADYP